MRLVTVCDIDLIGRRADKPSMAGGAASAIPKDVGGRLDPALVDDAFTPRIPYVN